MQTLMRFDPTDWYWVADDGRVYSSARCATVTASDPDYLAFLAAAGHAAPPWPVDAAGAQTMDALTALLATYGVATSLTARLVAHAYEVQMTQQNAGISVNIGSAATPDVVNVGTSNGALGLTTGAVQIPSLATFLNKPAPTSYRWINNIQPDGTAGARMSFSAAQVATMQYAVATYIQATFDTLGDVLDAIENGSITTVAAIDAAAWPATSY